MFNQETGQVVSSPIECQHHEIRSSDAEHCPEHRFWTDKETSAADRALLEMRLVKPTEICCISWWGHRADPLPNPLLPNSRLRKRLGDRPNGWLDVVIWSCDGVWCRIVKRVTRRDRMEIPGWCLRNPVLCTPSLEG